MYLIPVEGYHNAGVHTIKVKNDLWISIKDAGNGFGVKNISEFVLKEIQGDYEKKSKRRTKCFKMTEREIFKKFGKSNNN